MLNDVFLQMEDPQAGQEAQIDENIADALVQEVLEPVEPERPATPLERVFEDIDEYVGSVARDPKVEEGSEVQSKGKEKEDKYRKCEYRNLHGKT